MVVTELVGNPPPTLWWLNQSATRGWLAYPQGYCRLFMDVFNLYETLKNFISFSNSDTFQNDHGGGRSDSDDNGVDYESDDDDDNSCFVGG